MQDAGKIEFDATVPAERHCRYRGLRNGGDNGPFGALRRNRRSGRVGGVDAGAGAAEDIDRRGLRRLLEQTLRKEVFPDFEKKHGVKVEYVAGNSTDTLAKLQAQKGNQQIDVAILDDGPMYQAMQLGFCAPIEGLDKTTSTTALFPDNKAVAVGQSAPASCTTPRCSRRRAGRRRPRGTTSRIRSTRSSWSSRRSTTPTACTR